MKIKIVIYNAIGSIVLGVLWTLLHYYLWVKPDGVEYTFGNYASDTAIYTGMFFVTGLFGEWCNIRAEKKKNKEKSSQKTENQQEQDC